MIDTRHDPIVVTGIGLVTPLGRRREETWSALLGARSGIVRQEDGTVIARCRFEENGSHPALNLALSAAEEALVDALLPQERDRRDWGCVVSCSKSLLWESKGGFEVQPPETVPFAVARQQEIGGTVLNVTAACATGTQSIVTAAEWIRDGRCSVALAGAAESSLHPMIEAGFRQLGVLSDSAEMRPFDRRRNGFILGEGAAVLVLEPKRRARRRGARIYGELAGWDLSCDANHVTRFNSGGERMSRSIRRAIERAGLSPSEIGYFNPHGTATILNDDLETRACLNVFQGISGPAVSATKAATGHLLGASGAVELAFCLLALRDQRVPPSLNLDDPIDRGLDFVTRQARSATVSGALSTSFGFGGHMASVVVRKTG
ncbi:MAG TPA: beta-ketoacyl-[acyl-carrier-protein] synthase family protein [Elusimicrobiota bacterium]|nr:beta-ketoacyl-[acyl-carrier-protein] synthase family protein [Elusimicrobiota bacterium]